MHSGMLTQLSLSFTSSSVQSHASDYNAMQHDLNELNQMLLELKRGASKLVDDTQVAAAELEGSRGSCAKKSKVVYDKASAAKSPWAKSATPRSNQKVALAAAAAAAVDSISPNLQRAERFVKTRAASFTMAGRHPEPSSKQAVVYDAKYDVKVDALSSYKKVARVIRFGTAPKAPVPASTVAAEGGEEARAKVQRAESAPKDAAPVAYSFGKATREQPAKQEQPMSVLDTERAKSYLEPHTASMVITKPAPVMGVMGSNGGPVNASATATSSSSAAAAVVSSFMDGGVSGDALLSHRSRPPAAVMRPESANSAMRRMVAAERSRSNIGPGHYEVASSFRASSFSAVKEAKPPVGKLYHAPVRQNPDVLLRRAVEEHQRERQRPPSALDLSIADKHVFTQPPSFSMHPPEPKPSAHLERKLYWEDKARDMRLEHDDLRDADDSIVRPRSQVALIAKPPLPPEDAAANAKMRRVLQERRKLNEQIGSLAYDVKFDAVDKRAVGLVDMEAAVAAQKKVQDALANKPAVQLVLAEKRRPGGSDRVYGPQLQVPWATERAVPVAGDECPSPTKEVLELLDGRRDSLHGGALSEHAEHFLHSTYSGNLNRKATALMRPSPPRPPRRDDTFEYVLQTQAPLDWADSDVAVVDLARLPGRDSKRVITKDVLVYERFDEPLHKLSEYRKDPIGPGYYERPRGEGIGEVARGAPVFDLMVARARAIGPNGERPEGSALAEEERALALEAPTPVDYGRAKDAATATRRGERSLKLYERERFEAERQQPREEEGDAAAAASESVSYVKGIAEAALARPPVVDFARMRGRDTPEPHTDRDGDLSELEVTDWKPNLPKAPAVVFPDPLSAPRFPEERARHEEQGPPPLDPQRIDYIKPKTTVTYVNIALQTGRSSSRDVSPSDVQEAPAVPAASTANDPLARGFEMVTRLKRTPNAVSIGTQVGRDGHAVRDGAAAKPGPPRLVSGGKEREKEPHQTDDALLAEILAFASPSPPRKKALVKSRALERAETAPVTTVAADIAVVAAVVEEKRTVVCEGAVKIESGGAALTVEVEHSPSGPLPARTARDGKVRVRAKTAMRDWNFDAPAHPPRRRAELGPLLPREKEKKKEKGKGARRALTIPAPTPPDVGGGPPHPAPPSLSKYGAFGSADEELLQRELQKLGL